MTTDGHSHGHHGGNNNLRAAYLHVLADALTSVLAIVALLAGSLYGWLWLDPAMGIVGALVIARWSWVLIRDAGGVLVDYVPPEEDPPEAIRTAVTAPSDTITDLHVSGASAPATTGPSCPSLRRPHRPPRATAPSSPTSTCCRTSPSRWSPGPPSAEITRHPPPSTSTTLAPLMMPL